MTTFFIVFILSLAVITCSGLIINYSKNRTGNSKHRLTGMCHKTGGPASACSCTQLLTPEVMDCPSEVNRKT